MKWDHAICAGQSGIVAFMHIMDPNVFLINVFLGVCMMLILNNAYITESRDLLNIDESFHMFEKLTATVRMAVCNMWVKWAVSTGFIFNRGCIVLLMRSPKRYI